MCHIAAINDGAAQLAGYAYLGTGAVVETTLSQPSLRNTLVGTAGGTDLDSGDIYRGLDRFGRVKDAHWHNTTTGTSAARLGYGYDRASNRTYREDVVATSQNKNFDELYGHDGLDRLGDQRRGRLNAGKTALATTTFRQDWNLDATGNWAGFREDGDGNGTWDLAQSRTANQANEITGVTETAGPAWATPVYNPTGNMTTIPKPEAPAQGFAGTYDAWNRLVTLTDGTGTVQENEYDAINRRVIRKDYAAGVLDQTRRFYYSDDWQVLEERVDAASSPERQFVWGVRYVDDLILRDRDANGNGTPEERLYALQDANWNVVAVADSAGAVQERYAYSAYGTPLFLSAGFLPLAGSGRDWETLYAGCRLDPGRLYQVRNRFLHSGLGNWVSRDPADYDAGSMNLYEYLDGQPIDGLDPEGLANLWNPFSWGIPNPQGTWGDFLNPLSEMNVETAKGCATGLGHGAQMVGNSLTLHQIDALDQHVDELVDTHGGLYGAAQISGDIGAASLYAAGGLGAAEMAGFTGMGSAAIGRPLVNQAMIEATYLSATGSPFAYGLYQSGLRGSGASAVPLASLSRGQTASRWTNRLPGIQVRRVGNAWLKRVNPNSSRLMQLWGRQTIRAQAQGLGRLRAAGSPAARFGHLRRSGYLATENVGRPLSARHLIKPAYWRAAARDMRAMRQIMTDLKPGNYGPGYRAFDPAMDPITKGIGVVGGSAIGGATGYGIKCIIEDGK